MGCKPWTSSIPGLKCYFLQKMKLLIGDFDILEFVYHSLHDNISNFKSICTMLSRVGGDFMLIEPAIWRIYKEPSQLTVVSVKYLSLNFIDSF